MRTIKEAKSYWNKVRMPVVDAIRAGTSNNVWSKLYTWYAVANQRPLRPNVLSFKRDLEELIKTEE